MLRIKVESEFAVSIQRGEHSITVVDQATMHRADKSRLPASTLLSIIQNIFGMTNLDYAVTFPSQEMTYKGQSVEYRMVADAVDEKNDFFLCTSNDDWFENYSVCLHVESIKSPDCYELTPGGVDGVTEHLFP